MMTRRTAISVLSAPLAGWGAATTFDPNFGSALDAAAAIYLEDATPIRLASLLARENGGFTPPPGYE